MKVAVVGAGMGGLALARALQLAGIDVEVFEQSSELREVGAGVQVTPNATRVLTSLGLAEQLARDGCLAEVSQARRWDDFSLIAETELADSLPAQFGAPWYCVHRADLQAMLAASLTGDVVHLRRRLCALAETADGVRLDFADGSQATADVVVGADGIHSTVRTHLFGATPARFTGIVAYRGLVPAGEVADLGLPRGSTLVMGPDQHVVCYPVSAGRNVNWVALASRDDWTLESWTEPAAVTDALAAYQGWAPQLHRLIASAGSADRQIHRWALHDRDPLPVWGSGRITLLGDAAHPMLPFVAQGAAQAFEDAAVLARCLQRLAPLDALRAYEDLRRDRTAKVQLAARANSVLFHLPDGPDQLARDAAMSAPRPAGRHVQSWIFEYDAEVATSSL